ncbi:MAG: hypothetical protein DLD55_06295 [candidate division SR1 bacterium]|nr:MAG: hypothetical protein DLD55_06295 [candidate division SR1 bacterium]
MIVFMKRQAVYISILVGIFCSLRVNANFQVPNEESFILQEFAETTLKISTLNIGEDNPFPVLKTFLKQHCAPEALQAGEKLTQKLQIPWEKNLQQLNSLKEYENLFTSTKKLTLNLKKEDEKTFCSQKYLLYNLLDQIQTAFLGYQKEKTENYEHSAPPKEKKESQNEEKKHFTTNFQRLTYDYLTEEIKNLINMNILNKEEAGEIQEKIKINFFPSCEKAKGSFHLLQHKKTKEKHFKALKLNIGICQDKSYLAKYKEYFKQILAHELGHYLYFFKDQKSENFNSICWSKRKNTCKHEEFITTYAQQNQEEDYAESFAYWYKDQGKEKEFGSVPANEALLRKEKHFETLF